MGNGWPWEFTFKEVEAHIYNKDNKRRTAYSGTASSFSERDYPQKINPSLVWAKIPQGDTLNIWLKLSMAEASSSKIELSIQKIYIIEGSRMHSFLSSGHLIINGAVLALLLISLFLFLWFKDSVYLWFFLFQVSFYLMVFLGEFENEAYLIFFKNNPRLLVYVTMVNALFRIFTLLQFARVYINTKIEFPKIDLILKGLIFVFTCLTLFGILSGIFPTDLWNSWYSFKLIPMGLSFLIMIFVLIYFSFSKNILAKLFGLGMLLPFVAMIIKLILINISDNPGGVSSPRFFISLGMILTTTGILAYRFVKITQEKENATKEKLESDIEKLKQEQLAEQKTKEAARLEELDEIKSNFFSNITHEFRTPLTLIIEPLRQVIEQPNKAWIEKVKLAKNNSQKLLHLINQLLDISKIENNQMNLELKRGDINELIQPLVNSFALLAKEKQIELSYNNQSSIRLFDFDKNKMEKIISNLISNAIKFTENKGSIQIEIKEEKHLKKRISDLKLKMTASVFPKKIKRISLIGSIK